MGKKTNWHPAEDQTLTRVWLSASESQLHGGEQKPPHFWTTVYDLFHQEVETERPLTGLKVRWTRINRDSQKFAAIFNELQRQHKTQSEDESDGDSEEADAVALLKEQQWIEEAKGSFHRHYNSKFLFESSWKQLRDSAKWLQLCTNSNIIVPNISNSNISHPVVVMSSVDPSKAMAEAGKTHAVVTPSEVAEQEITTDTSVAHVTAASTAAQVSIRGASSVAASAVVAAAAEASASDESSVSMPPRHKRRAEAPLEALSNNPLPELTTTLVDELKRQNDLMEDQHAIALLKVDGDMIADAEGRHCYQLLRARYLKRIRRGYSNGSDRSSTSV